MNELNEPRVSPSVRSLKEAAYSGRELPDGLSGAAQKFYLKARMLYEAKLLPDQGRREMAEIERAYEQDQFDEEAAREHAMFWKKIEFAAREYAKTDGTKEGDSFFAAVYDLPPEWRVKRGKGGNECGL